MSTGKNAEFEKVSAEVCRRVRNLTAQKGWTRTELSKKSGVSYRLVHEIMHENASLRDDTLGKLANALEVSVAQLEGKEDQPDGGLRYENGASTPMILREERMEATRNVTLMEAITAIAAQLHVDPEAVIKAMLELANQKGGASNEQ